MPVFGEFLHRTDRGELLLGAHRDEVDDRFSFTRRADFRDLVHFTPVHLSAIGEDEYVIVGGGNEEPIHEVLVTGPHADPPLAPAFLLAVNVDRTSLDIAPMGHGDDHVLFHDHVLHPNLAGLGDDLGATGIGVLFLDFEKLLSEDLLDPRFAGQNGFQLRNQLLDLFVLVYDFLALHPSQAMELEIENRLGLDLRELVTGDQLLPRLGGRARGTDEVDDLIQMIERLDEALQDVCSRFCSGELEGGSSANDLATKIKKLLDDFEKPEDLGPILGDGEEDDSEARLQGRVLVEIVQNHLRHFASFELHHDTHAAAVRFVTQVRDPFDLPVSNQLGNFLQKPRFVHLVRDLGDDDRLALLADVFDLGPGAQLNRASPGSIGLLDSLPTMHETRGREIGPRYSLQ